MYQSQSLSFSREHNETSTMETTSSPGLARLEEIGVVGAGGGGFPAAAKLRTRVSTLIVNAAECEPLLHKDKEVSILN